MLLKTVWHRRAEHRMVRYHHHIRYDSRIYASTSPVQKNGVEPDHLYNLVLWLIPVCILCARAYYVLFEWEQYKDNLLSVFQINKGGLAIYALKACRLSRCPPNPVPKSKDRRLLHLFSAWFLHRTKWCPAEPTPTNRGCQTVPHPPVTALHRRFSHKEYYQNSWFNEYPQ